MKKLPQILLKAKRVARPSIRFWVALPMGLVAEKGVLLLPLV